MALSCELLTYPPSFVWINQGEKPVPLAKTLPEPVDLTPLSLNDIITYSHNSRVPLYFFYQTSGAFCGYPILEDFPIASVTDPPRVPFPEQDPYGYGKLTDIKERDNFFSPLNFFVTSDGMIYTPSTLSSHWYLVGGQIEVEQYIEDFLEYFRYLEGQQTRWTNQQPRVDSSLPPYSPEEAKTEINLFLDWLKLWDRPLWMQVQNRITYEAVFSYSSHSNCQSPWDLDEADYDAYYDSTTENIVLLTPTIERLTCGKYEEVAQIIKHEWVHHLTFMQKKVFPSAEIFYGALSLLYHEGYANPLWLVAECNLFPIIPEAEMIAFSEEASSFLAPSTDMEVEALSYFLLAEDALQHSGLPARVLNKAIDYYLNGTSVNLW